MLPDDLHINEFDFTQLQSRMSVFIANSGSGKTQLMLDCLYRLKDIIPTCIVISPTESQNLTYSGIVPSECIMDQNISSDKLLMKLNDIY